MDERMDLKRFLSIMKKRFLTILVTAIVFFGISAVATLYFIEPTYEAQEFIFIGSLNDEETVADTQRVSRLMASSMDLISSSVVFDQVKRDVNVTEEDLSESIAVTNSQNSQIITISVQDLDPDRAKLIAQATATASVDKMGELLNIREVEVLSKNDSGSKEVGSSTLNMAIGLTVGLLVGIGLAMLRDYFDDTLQDAKEIDWSLGLPVIGELTLNDKKYARLNKKMRRKREGLNRKGGKMHAQSNTSN